MTEKAIPIVTVHQDYKPYIKFNLELTATNNTVIIIGTPDMKFLEDEIQNVQYINKEEFSELESIKSYKHHFKNYSLFNDDFAWYCTERMFIVEKFMEQYNYDQVFHIDTDNVVLIDINKIKFEKKTAYHISQFQNQFSMDASLHSGLLNLDFCKTFNKLYEDIYINKSKFHLIEEKYKHHIENNLKGGVCDMTMYYLIDKLNLIDVQNLMKPVQDKLGNSYIFVNNINLPEGYFGKQNFKFSRKKVKIIKKKYIYDEINNQKISIAGIHFQGTAKKYLNKFLKYKLKP